MIILNNSVVIKLVKTILTKDSNGVEIPTEAAREVFADMDNVSGREWFEGGRVGVNPEYRFTMFEADYQGEEFIEFEHIRYGVYRTYTTGDWIELYVERRNGSPSLYPESGLHPGERYPTNTTFVNGGD